MVKVTRINLIPPQELNTKHLFAEIRELPRVFSYVLNHGIPKDMPDHYVLGIGHIKFFCNKLNWLVERYELLYNEWISRGFKLSYTPQELIDKYEELLVLESQQGDIEYFPTEQEIQTNRDRILERLQKRNTLFILYD